MPTVLLSLLCLSAAPQRFGALEVQVPAGFSRSDNRLVSPNSEWIFEGETSTKDPAQWAAGALAAVTGGLREPLASQLVKQTNRAGLEVWMAAGSGYNDAGRLVCFILIAATDVSSGRAQASRFQTDTQTRLNQERLLLEPSVSTLAFKGPPPPAVAPARQVKQPLPPPAAAAPVPSVPVAAQPTAGGLPDGPYSCSRLTMARGMRGALEPNYVPSYIDNRVGRVILRGNRYEASELKQGGAVRQVGARLTFVDGPLAGWTAATGRNSSGPFFRVRSSATTEPGESVKAGDDICYGR